MTWEEAGLISKYPEVMETLREYASRNVAVPALQNLKADLEYKIETGNYVRSLGEQKKETNVTRNSSHSS